MLHSFSANIRNIPEGVSPMVLEGCSLHENETFSRCCSGIADYKREQMLLTRQSVASGCVLRIPFYSSVVNLMRLGEGAVSCPVLGMVWRAMAEDTQKSHE